MKLGKASMVLAVALVPVMYMVAVWQVGRANQPPFTDPLTWTIVPLAVIVPFAVMIWNGWKHRKNAQWHKRSMLSAAILIVAGPSIGRMPVAQRPAALHCFFLGLLLFVAVPVGPARPQALHPATKLGFSMLLVSIAIPLFVFWTGVDWASVAASTRRFGDQPRPGQAAHRRRHDALAAHDPADWSFPAGFEAAGWPAPPPRGADPFEQSALVWPRGARLVSRSRFQHCRILSTRPRSDAPRR
jgi:hypothetical protein